MDLEKRVSFREDPDTEPLLPDVQILSPDDDDDDEEEVEEVEQEPPKCNRCGFPRRRCTSEGPFVNSWADRRSSASEPEPIPVRAGFDGPSIAASLPAQ